MREASETHDAAKLVLGVVSFNNSREQISQLMRSVEIAVARLAGMPVSVELNVIDNGAALPWPESDLKFHKFDSVGNIGFGKGMNLLMAAAFSDSATSWFLCVNPDGVLHYKVLSELLSSADAFPDSLIAARQFPEEHPKEYDPDTLDVSWASGACLLIPRRIYETVGGFDPDFFMYMEDIDYSWRARAAGFSVKFAPKALFGHDVLEREVKPEVEKYFLLSSRYLGLKWQNPKFVKWVEKELISRRLFASRADLPSVPQPDMGKGKLDPAVADFKHQYYFAPGRW